MKRNFNKYDILFMMQNIKELIGKKSLLDKVKTI